MKKYIATTVRKWLSASVRFKTRRTVLWLQEQISRACLWNWEITRLPLRRESTYGIMYVGRKSQRELAKNLLDIRNVDNSPAKGVGLDRMVFISETTFPGALCIPTILTSIVPLGRPIEEITATYHSQLRREIKKNRALYRLQQVHDMAEIEQANREMLLPYARARHGVDAVIVELDEVKRMVQEYGRLDLLLLGDEVVGCQTAYAISRAGKRYWSTHRCGYPEAVFSDPKRLRDSNSFNVYLAMEWANENGFDYYDIGVSLGRPGDGLLEWKRRRGAEVSSMDNIIYFHIRLPKVGASQFLWDTPLFAVERFKLTLHLGLPLGPNDDEVKSRYGEMGFGGLFKVYLHCARTPSEQILETIRGYYAHLKSPPMLEIIAST